MTKNLIAYGYMRVHNSASDQELMLIENQLHAYARAHDLWLTDIHYEWGPGISPQHLVRRLIRDEVRHVIVPSLVQITEHPLMQVVVLDGITLDAGALLYETSEIHGRADVR